MNWRRVLQENGLEKLACVLRLDLEAWWDSERKIEIRVLDFGSHVLIRGTKSYFVKMISEQTELFARDLQSMVEWFNTTFPTVTFSLHSCRDVSRSLVIARIREKRFRETGEAFDPERDEERLKKVRAEFDAAKGRLQDHQALTQLASLSSVKTPTLETLLRNQGSELKRDAVRRAEEGKRLEKSTGVGKALVEAYERNASAVSLVVSVTTEGIWVDDEKEFADGLRAITKELVDSHKYRVRQKLAGQLKIPVEQSDSPAVDWLSLYAGGYPTPQELERWGSTGEGLRKEIESRFMVTPVRDIIVEGHVKDQKKLVMPRVIRTFLSRLPREQPQSAGAVSLPFEGELFGRVMDGVHLTRMAFLQPKNPGSTNISGTTRAGKSSAGHVAAENCIIQGVIVIALDSTRQWCGLARPASDENTLRRLDEFGIGRKHATGFDVDVYLPGAGLELPRDPRELVRRSSVISTKGLDDFERCRIARDVLQVVYDHTMDQSDQMRILVVLEEAHNLLPSNVAGGKAEEMAKEVRNLILRTAREKNKYGCNQMVISQSLADFRGDARVVREMINLRIFARATDRAELEFVEHYISKDAVEVVKNLQVGEVLVHGASVPTTKVLVRPPLSEVRELSDHEILSGASPLHGHRSRPDPLLTQQERAALDVVRQHFMRTGTPMPAKEFGKKLGIQGGSRQRLITGLESKGCIKTVEMERVGRGRPPQGLVPTDRFVPNGGIKGRINW